MNSTIEKMTRTLELFLTILLFGMFLMIATLVVLRYVLGTTIIGGNEAPRLARALRYPGTNISQSRISRTSSRLIRNTSCPELDWCS
jgi:hypothetical protein